MVDGGNRPQGSDVDNGVTTNAAPDGSGSATRTAVLAESVLDRRYRLLSPLNTRGPVTLWRGDDNVLARPVAVRIVEHIDSADPSGDGGGPAADERHRREDAARRLLTAAVNSGRLVHPGAASTYDATTTTTEAGRISYVVSEWVEGKTLRQLAAEGSLRPEQAGAVVLAAARVLAAAHERGIHHGGLNPGDVIVSSHGTVKVVDLEIGGVLASLDDRPDGLAVLGAEGSEPQTPEQADVRALGALLYAGLTGTWPLVGDQGLPAAQVAGGRLRTPRQVNPAVPRDLDAITLATLGDERAGNPITTAAELVAELEAVNPVDAVLDTGLMSLSDDAPVSTEAMPMGPFGPATQDYPAPSGYDDRAPYGGRPPYDDRAPYRGQAGYGELDRTAYDPAGYGMSDPYATRVDRGDRPGYGDYDGYAPGGYPPAQRGGGYPPPTPPEGRRRADRRADSGSGGLRRALPWVACALVVVVIAVVAVLTMRGDGNEKGDPLPGPSEAPPVGAPIAFESVTSFDPLGEDKVEKPGEVARVFDGDPSTYWSTEGYRDPAPFGNLKSGVGLRFDFSQPITPSEIEVTVGPLAPVSFEIRAAGEPSGNINDYQTVATMPNATGTVQVALPAGQTAKSWVLWLTHLPRDPGDGQNRGSIAEIEFRS